MQLNSPNTLTGALCLSPAEAARCAGVGRTLIFAEIRAGRLVAKKAGRRTLISVPALDAWIEALPTRVPKEV